MGALGLAVPLSPVIASTAPVQYTQFFFSLKFLLPPIPANSSQNLKSGGRGVAASAAAASPLCCSRDMQWALLTSEVLFSRVERW